MSVEAHKFHKSIEVICDRLFKAENRRLDKMIDELGKRNAETLGIPDRSFMFKGKLFQPASQNVRYKRPPTLSFSLQDQGNACLSDRNNIEQDRKMIQQLLIKMTYNCMTVQEFRDTIPRVLLPLIPEYASMPHIHQEHYLAPKDERFRRELEKVLPKIEFYSVTHLIY